MMEIACHAMEHCFPLFTVMTVLKYLLFISKMNCIINQRIEHPFHSPQNVTQEKNFNYDNLEVYIRLERLFVVKSNHLKSVIAIYGIT